MAVQSVRGSEGKTRSYKMAASTTVVAGTFLGFTSGYVRPAVAGDTGITLIARESKTSGAGEYPEILCEELDSSVVIEADTAGDLTQAMVGTKVDLTNASTVNQAGTTTKVVLIVGYIGALTNRKALVKAVTKDS